MRFSTASIVGFVVLGLAANASAQAKKSNNLGSSSARNAAAKSGLAPKPNYNAPNPFAKPPTANNTARGNIAVQNPATGRTQVFVPQKTAGGNTILKSPSTGTTHTLQKTATGGQMIKGSNGNIYIPPNTSSSSGLSPQMQQYNKDKALYEKLHAQGRLPSQQPKPIVTTQPQATTPTLEFEIPSFESGDAASANASGSATVIQPQFVPTVPQTIDFGTPVFEAPATNLENTIPFQGSSTTITNPAATRGPVKFTVDGTAVTLQPGMEITYDSKATYVIEFTRGGGQGKTRYTLAAGTNYNFSVSAAGWELMSAVAESEPENEIPNAILNPDSQQTANDLLDFGTLANSDQATKDLSAILAEVQRIEQTTNQSTVLPQVPALQPEFVRGSKIFIINSDAQLYDGSKPLTTPKLFQKTFTVLDSNDTHVMIEHAGKKGWVKKSDGILSLADGF